MAALQAEYLGFVARQQKGLATGAVMSGSLGDCGQLGTRWTGRRLMCALGERRPSGFAVTRCVMRLFEACSPVAGINVVPNASRHMPCSGIVG
jgi:hypothetical protein